MIGWMLKRSRDPARELKDLLEGYTLPSFRTQVLSTLRLLRDEDATVEQIAEQIELDPGMHVRVLRTVNAAAFGLSTPVASVRHAVTMLGRSRIEPIVLTLAVGETLSQIEASGFDASNFWYYAATRAAAARGFARHLHPATQHESFTAGLLLDLAIPVLATVKGATYIDLYRTWTSEGTPGLSEIERKVLGYDHAAAGVLIADTWDLPDYLRIAIGTHHQPEDTDLEPGLLLAALLRDRHDEEDVERIRKSASERFGMAPATAESVMEKAFEEATEFSRLMA